MYKIDVLNKELIELSPTDFGSNDLKERFDIQEWLAKQPAFLGEELLIISKELEFPSKTRLDLLGIDKQGCLVVIEVKRDDSGSNVEWQAIRYVSYCANYLPEKIYTIFAEYSGSDQDHAKGIIEDFIDVELDMLNEKQRIFLVSRKFHSDVISAVLWLRDYELDISCIRLDLFKDHEGQLFISPDTIIPLPEAKDYIQQKEAKQRDSWRIRRSPFSLEKGDFPEKELNERIKKTLQRDTDLTPRLKAFFKILLTENREFKREEIKKHLYEEGLSDDISQAGRHLSNISQFMTKRANTHLRQIIEFDTGGGFGETKENYKVLDEYRDLLNSVLGS